MMPDAQTRSGNEFETPGAAERSLLARRGATRAPRLFRIHAAALGLLLLVLLPLIGRYDGAIAFPDEGLYSAQVALLDRGSWSGEQGAQDIDAPGTFDPLGSEHVDDGRYTPYGRRPLYPLVLLPFYALGGASGLLLVSVVATWAAAVGSGLLARRIDASLAAPALWLAGLGSPLLFGAYLVIGHSLAAALSTALLLTVALVLDDRRQRWMVALAPLVVALVLLRSEGSVFVVALAGALGVSAIGLRGRLRVDRLRAGTAGVVLASGAFAYLLDSRLASWLTGASDVATGSVVSHRGPWSATWVSLLRPWNDATAAEPSTVLILLGLLGAALALLVTPRRPLVPMAMLAMAAGAGIWRLFGQLDLVTGLVPAFPVLAALLLLRATDLRNPQVARLVLVTALGTAMLVLLIYDTGGSAEWGGRFFHVLLPAMIPLVTLGLFRGRELLPSSVRRVAMAFVAIAVLSLSITSLRINLETRRLNEQLVTRVEQVLQRRSTNSEPLVLTTTVTPSGTSRAFWEQVAAGDDYMAFGPLGRFEGLLRSASEAGRESVVLVTNHSPQSLPLILGELIRSEGWSVTESRGAESGFVIVLIERS